jgi:hypothetical protein
VLPGTQRQALEPGDRCTRAGHAGAIISQRHRLGGRKD